MIYKIKSHEPAQLHVVVWRLEIDSNGDLKVLAQNPGREEIAVMYVRQELGLVRGIVQDRVEGLVADSSGRLRVEI